MAFMMEDGLIYQDNCLLTDQEVCRHFILEDASVPEEETSCARCETNWFQRLQEVVERSVGTYTTAYPCMSLDREQAHIVPHLLTLPALQGSQGQQYHPTGEGARHNSSGDQCAGGPGGPRSQDPSGFLCSAVRLCYGRGLPGDVHRLHQGMVRKDPGKQCKW